MLILAHPLITEGSRQSIIMYERNLDRIGSDPSNRLIGIDRPAKPDLLGYIRYCGLRIESTLSDIDLRLDAVGICWYPDHVQTIMLNHVTNLRGDEMIFHHLNVAQPIGWVIGHPRSILKWAATLADCWSLEDYWPTRNKVNIFETGVLVWWAQRINLKVYSAR